MGKQKKPLSMTFSEFIFSHNSQIEILVFIILLGYGVVVWFISYEAIFHIYENQSCNLFYSIGLLFTLLHFLLKIILNSRQLIYESIFKYYIKLYIFDLVIFVYFSLKIAYSDNRKQTLTTWFILYDIIFIISGYRRASQIYKSFKMKVITTIYKDYLNLFDLLATSFIMAHVFALILFLSSNLSQSHVNWLKKAQIEQSDPQIQYIYSFHFACSTMLTVGYGDLVPSNIVQIIAVLVIQVIGIAIFAYVINEIGHTLSSMRKQEESLQRDLSSLSKISKYYGLDEELQTKARAYIIDNRTSINELLPQEEKQLLMKLKDDRIHQRSSQSPQEKTQNTFLRVFRITIRRFGFQEFTSVEFFAGLHYKDKDDNHDRQRSSIFFVRAGDQADSALYV